MAQAVQLSRVMLEKSKNLNTQNGALPVLTAANFKAEVLASELPVLVEFWTAWSRPCQVLDCVLRELAGDWREKVKFVKVDADDSLDLSLCYDIQSVPTLLCFVAGRPSFRIVGTATREALEAKIKSLSQ